MKKIAISFAVVFSLCFFVVYSSFADSHTDEYVVAKLSSYEDQYPSAESSSGEVKETETSSFDYYNIKGSGFEFIDVSDNGGAAGKVPDFHAYVISPDYPQPLAQNITFEFRQEGEGHAGLDLSGPSGISDVFMIGAAFLTNLAVHEFGHEIVADYVGARGSKVGFFKNEGGSFFLGTSSVEEVDERSRLSYHMGGEVFADMAFEHALEAYREGPTMYNKSLLLFSGTDFAWYCLYAYYLSNGHTNYDPVSIQEETGLSESVIFSAAIAKTMMNAYRVYSGQDRVIPYFMVDRYSASMNLAVAF